MNKVYFIFSKSRKWYNVGSWIIRKVENVPFSHVSVMIDGQVFEAVFPKVREISYKDWLKKYKMTHLFSVNVELDRLRQIEKRCKSHIGKRYSISQLVMIGLGFLDKGLNSWIESNQVNGSQYMICTELLADVMKNEFNVDLGEVPDTISMSEAFALVEKLTKDC